MPSVETTPAVKLRGQVVTEVVRSLIALTFLLYLAIFVLLVLQRDVPEALWYAAGGAAGSLSTLLVNSKVDTPPPGSPGGPPIPVEGVIGGTPVKVDPEPEPEPPFEHEQGCTLDPDHEGDCVVEAPEPVKKKR